MIDYKEITDAICKTFKTTAWWVESDECKRNKRYIPLDVRLCEEHMRGKGEMRSEEERDAVLCFILAKFPDVKKIAYGGVYASAETILSALCYRYLSKVGLE